MKWADWIESAVYVSNRWDSTVGRTIWTFLPYYLLYEDMEYGIDRDQFTINLQYVSTYMWMQIHKFIITYYI